MVRPSQDNAAPSWISLIQQSGEANLGQAMIRLARLAAERHARMLASEAIESADGINEAREADAMVCSSTDEPAHKEVSR